MFSEYDLHSHSTASDGTLSPSELVSHAASVGVKVLALTDHDTLSGLAEAQNSAVSLPIVVLNGVEISVTWEKRTIHIVGLNIDPDFEDLQEGLDRLSSTRQWRAEEMGRQLEKHGIEGTYEAAAALSNGTLVTRTHFARVLVEKGLASNVRDVFKKYLVSGKPGFVRGEWASLEQAVSLIKRAGGRAVIAHPARYRLTKTKLRQLISDFIAAGGEALEVISGSHSKDEYFVMAQYAKDFGLLASAGSDYHGPENPWIKLGQLSQLPPGCNPVWKDWDLIH